MVGSSIEIADSELLAKTVAASRRNLEKFSVGMKVDIDRQAASPLTSIVKESFPVPIVLKADTQGSLEAIVESIAHLNRSDDTGLAFANIISSSVGVPSTSDIQLAAATKAQLIVFNSPLGSKVSEMAKFSGVAVKEFNVIYHLLEDIGKQINEALCPCPSGKLIGKALIKKVIALGGKSGKVAGCEVLEGKATVHASVRVMRGSRQVLFAGDISSLRSFKNTVEEVEKGKECGISFPDFSDFDENDTIEFFEKELKEEAMGKNKQ